MLPCVTLGYPKPEISWLKGDDLIKVCVCIGYSMSIDEENNYVKEKRSMSFLLIVHILVSLV